MQKTIKKIKLKTHYQEITKKKHLIKDKNHLRKTIIFDAP